jgi:hypothetical protein
MGRGKSVWAQLQLDPNVILEFCELRLRLRQKGRIKCRTGQKCKLKKYGGQEWLESFAYMQRNDNASAGAPVANPYLALDNHSSSSLNLHASMHHDVAEGADLQRKK